MRALDPRTLARVLGGDVQRNGALVPGPGHSRKDRSLSVTITPGSPDGLLVHSHCGQDWQACKDYVRERLGLKRPRREQSPNKVVRLRPPQAPADDAARKGRALALWNAAVDPGGTPVETYLRTRGLNLPDEVAGDVVRFHPACPWRHDDERLIYVPAMVAAMRNVATDEITAVHRTRLSPDGAKLDRKMLGVAGGSAIKLDADDAVTNGLFIGEGIETVLAARQLGLKPAWAMGSVGGIASFPVLSGIECLSLLAERQIDGAPNVASDKAIQDCGHRWHAAGREVLVIEPPAGDVNDAMQAARAG